MTQTTSPPTTPSIDDTTTAESVIIRPWPKVVFLYPTFAVAAIAFLLSLLDLNPVWLGNTFTIVLCLNLLVFSFDFSRIKSITILVGGIALALLLLWADTKWEVTGVLGNLLGGIDVTLSTEFYGVISAFMGFLFLIVFINFFDSCCPVLFSIDLS